MCDLIPYEVEILEDASGDVRRVHMPWVPGEYSVGWSDGDSGSMHNWRHTNCDCVLYGYWVRGPQQDAARKLAAAKGLPLEFRFGGSPPEFQCDHKMPPMQYTALRAFISDGRVIDLRTGEVAKQAA